MLTEALEGAWVAMHEWGFMDIGSGHSAGEIGQGTTQDGDWDLLQTP